MAGSGASSTICCLCGSHNMLMILLKKTDISNVGAWRYAQMFVGRSSSSNKPQKNDFWAPDGDRTWKPSADRWDVLTIELPRPRMVSKGQGHCEENWRKWGGGGGGGCQTKIYLIFQTICYLPETIFYSSGAQLEECWGQHPCPFCGRSYVCPFSDSFFCPHSPKPCRSTGLKIVKISRMVPWYLPLPLPPFKSPGFTP